MDVHVWQAPIRAQWHKSNALIDLKYAPDVLEIVIQEEDTRAEWTITFKELAGIKIIVGDSAHWSLQPLPPDGGFFNIVNSPWLSAMGLTETNDQRTPHHYVVSCKRELIEVIAYSVSFSS